MLCGINQVCFDLHNICLERDKVLNNLKDIDICVGDFKRVTVYYKEDEEQSATSTSMPVPKRKLEIFPSEAQGIPMVRIRDPRKSNVGQQILQEVIDDVNVSNIQVGEIITSTSGNTSPHSPLGILQNYFYRVEFQHRGSPHIHGLLWIKIAPHYEKNNETEIIQYIDKIISCSFNEKHRKYTDLQIHKHSKTCIKKSYNKKTVQVWCTMASIKHNTNTSPT